MGEVVADKILEDDVFQLPTLRLFLMMIARRDTVNL
jgi:hypothetical protein